MALFLRKESNEKEIIGDFTFVFYRVGGRRFERGPRQYQCYERCRAFFDTRFAVRNGAN